MDKFGFIQGRRGPPGPAGKDALQLDVWCTKSVLQQFKASASCAFYFDTESDGILDKKKGLKNRIDEGRYNAKTVRDLQTPVKTGKSYSLPLSTKSCFEIPTLRSALKPSSVFIVAFSFKLTEAIKDGLSYYIFSNTNSTRAVTLRKDWLDIAGCERGSPQLKYKIDSWNYMLIQYSRVSEDGSSDRCFFILNGRRGFFEPKVYENDAVGLYIGHKLKKTANIELNYFQVHYVHESIHKTMGYVLPEIFSSLLLKDMKSRVHLFGEEDEE